ncbi:MAG: AtpZ/AtpI family protein [Acidobacteria bacterium]|nr:AtpZ/AtpI family protein [Acidobacteriota bacterium]
MKRERSVGRLMSDYMNLALILPVSLLVGYGIGLGLDHVFGTHFWYIVWLIAGVVAAARGPARVGAVAAWANFRWLERVFSRPTPARAGMLGLRLAVLGGVGYVMLKIFAVSPVAFLVGLLTAVMAAMSETVYQLIYARNS